MIGIDNKTRTLVVLTVPGAGKTWYKNNYDKCISENSPMKFPLVFDMGEYDDKLIKEQEFAFLNLIYITRKLHMSSIVMINGTRRLMQLMKNNDIPHIALVPKNRYRYSMDYIDLFENTMYMDHNSTFKNQFDTDQHLSDKIDKMWTNTTVTEDSWFAYDRKWKFV